MTGDNMRRLTIAGLIAALTLGTFGLVASALVASAQTRPNCIMNPKTDPCWPAIGAQVLQEWFSDLPWTQKLGTYRGNEIDQAFMLPYAALPPQNVTYCTNSMGPQPQPPTGVAGQTWEARCMIGTGINSIVGILRTDTLYSMTDSLITGARRCQPGFTPAAGCTKTLPYCLDGTFPCTEVRLAVSMFWTRSDDSANKTLTLDPRPIGMEPPACPTRNPPPNCSIVAGGYYGGFVLTDGSSYGPQLPWYMSHYCDSQFPSGTNDVQDPACYADYLSPMNDGFNGTPLTWPNSVQPWSVFPSTPPAQPPLPSNHCAPGTTTTPPLTSCTFVMGVYDFDPVPSLQAALQYSQYNGNLLAWFNNALAQFPINFSTADLQRHFPWNGPWNQMPVTQVSWTRELYPQAALNPFLGQFTYIQTAPGVPPSGCDVGFTGPTPAMPCADNGPTGMTQTAQQRADHFIYPRQCALTDLAALNAAKLRQCGVNYEIHPNGWLEQWPNSYWPYINTAGMAISNQYGRTSFLFAGVPGMQLPVSFYKIPGYANGLCRPNDLCSVYEQVHNSSLFSLYLPIANEADQKMAYPGRNYSDSNDEFYHDVLMSNHMESAPADFAEGIRGKVLWHNEYRSQKMYNASANLGLAAQFPTMTFPASFSAMTAPAPYHNHTCDGCHVRNGSGIPVNTAYMLDAALQGLPGCQGSNSCFMTAGVYSPYVKGKDYTFTGEIKPMKLVFFDLARAASTMTTVDDSVYSKPLTLVSAGPGPGPIPYNNKIMNFYGDSFHVTRPGYNYSWSYGPASANRIVDGTARTNAELGITYQPLQVNLGPFVTPTSCQLASRPANVPVAVWPANCNDIDADAITVATNGGVPTVGFMLLNGKRLSNLGAIEAIPNAAITFIQQNQVNTLSKAIAGEILWTSGTRGGVGGDLRLACTPTNLMTCYIGRFGWLGDRVSLEDQVANAAFVEMNMTTKMGYNQLYPNGNAFPVRYNLPNCGPADKVCVTSGGNADLLEEDIDRMADYARWLGSPTRSEFTVSLPDVVAGETIFRQLKCNQCHVIGKIPITNPDDTMLTKVYRDRLTTQIAATATPPNYPFLSYLGTDLLVHDMGYLSQVGIRSAGIRDPATGVVFNGCPSVLTTPCNASTRGYVQSQDFRNYVQKIRTPPLKGLRFNRFVTDSQLNTIPVTSPTLPNPACDFLLHDGRACDAIEAAFLHDGPAIKALGVIPALSGLSATGLRQLRAFLYSL
jgi:hypothetical protein